MPIHFFYKASSLVCSINGVEHVRELPFQLNGEVFRVVFDE
jgi:hypothetical protein